VQRSEQLALRAQIVRVLRSGQRVGIELDDRVHSRAVLIEPQDPVEVEVRQLD